MKLKLHVSIVPSIKVVEDKHVLPVSVVNDGVVDEFVRNLEQTVR